MPCCCFEQENALWCTKRCRMAVLYRKTPSGVPSDAARLFCTWKRPLVYQAMPHGCFVHGSALWCTKRYRAAVLYRETPSGVPSDAVLLFCTWERPLVYQAMPAVSPPNMPKNTPNQNSRNTALSKTVSSSPILIA